MDSQLEMSSHDFKLYAKINSIAKTAPDKSKFKQCVALYKEMKNKRNVIKKSITYTKHKFIDYMVRIITKRPYDCSRDSWLNPFPSRTWIRMLILAKLYKLAILFIFTFRWPIHDYVYEIPAKIIYKYILMFSGHNCFTICKFYGLWYRQLTCTKKLLFCLYDKSHEMSSPSDFLFRRFTEHRLCEEIKPRDHIYC